MNTIPKFVVTVVVIMLAVLICIGMIFTGLTFSSARTYHNDVISQLEDSRFDEEVINTCISKANNKGYQLLINKEMNVSSVEHYKVELYYNIVLPVFGKIHTGHLIGYAYPGATFYEITGEADHYFEIDDNGVLGIKAEYRWATELDNDYVSDNGKDAPGSLNAQLPPEITIPTYFNGVKVKSLRDYMFANCKDLIKLNFENGPVEIGDYAFQNCSNLLGVVKLPNTLKTIGTYSFDNCVNVQSVDFGTSLNTIGDYAFQNCSKITTISLPDTLTQNGFGTFKGCEKVVSFKAPFVGASPTASKKTGGYIGHIFGSEDYEAHNSVVPSELSTVEITSYVTMYACYDMDQLKNLKLGDKITEFDAYPFAYCEGLTSVTIPKNVTKTDFSAFNNCVNLKTVVFEEGSKLTTLGASAFNECAKLETIQLPNTLKEIGSYCFEGCDSLTFQEDATGKIPSGVTTIGNGAYSYCNSPSFTELVIPTSVTSIDYALVNESKYVKTISVEADNAAYCTGANGELLTKDRKTIVQYPYAASTSYTVPASVTTIFKSAFADCEKLETLKFEANSNLTTIENSAFSHCSDIAGEVVLPDSVVSIEDYAFYHSGTWSTFTIGSKIKTIGKYAFYDAGGTGSKTYLLTTTAPTLGEQVFFTNTISSGTITKNSINVKNESVQAAFVNNTHYRSDYTDINLIEEKTVE